MKRNPEFIYHKKGHIRARLTVVIYKEDDYCYAYSPALDLIAEGQNAEEAKKHFDESFGLYIEHGIENDTLNKDLKAHGWEVKKWKKRQYSPNDYNVDDIMRDKGVTNFSPVVQEIDIPVAA